MTLRYSTTQSFATIPGMQSTSLLQGLIGMIYTEKSTLMMDSSARELSMESSLFLKNQKDSNQSILTEKRKLIR